MIDACMMVRLFLPEESVIGGAAVAVWGMQRGDIGVCSWGVKGVTGQFKQLWGGLVWEWPSQSGAVRDKVSRA